MYAFSAIALAIIILSMLVGLQTKNNWWLLILILSAVQLILYFLIEMVHSVWRLELLKLSRENLDIFSEVNKKLGRIQVAYLRYLKDRQLASLIKCLDDEIAEDR